MQVVPNSRQTNQAYANSSQPPATQGPIQQPENSGSYWDQRRASQAGEMAAQNASSQSVGGAGTANLPADWEPQMTISPGPPASVPMAPGQVMWQGEPSHPGTIQQLNGNAGPYPQPSVEQAYHTQQNDQASNITLAGQSSAPQGPISQPTSTNPAAGGGSTAGGWSYEQGRREAALLGMSAGPGQVFPYVRQTQQPLTGTDWRTNGSPSSSPAQYQPSGVRPTDFNAMIQNPQVVPAATNGSQPSSIQQGNAPANAGAPTNAVHSQQQYFQHRPTQQSTGDFYQNAAAQQSNQAWGQMPQPSHFGVTPSSSNPYQGSATNFAPPTANVTPAPYYQRADASPAGQTQQAGYQQTAPYGVVPAAVSWDGAVNPEQYRKATRPNVDSQTLPVIQGRPSNMAPANSPSYTSPMIVPNQR